MLENEEIARILLAVFSMMMGVFVFRMAHNVSNAKTTQKFRIGKALDVKDEEKLQRYYSQCGKCLNTFAILWFANGAIFAYIPDVVLSLGINVIVLAIGVWYVLYGYHKAKKEAEAS